MKQTFLITALLFFLPFYGVKGAENLMQKAQQHYDNKEYTLAMECYKKILSSEPSISDATLFYNIANTYYRQGELGRAILNYERAVRIAPQNKETRHSLKVANNQVVKSIDYSTPYLQSIRDNIFQVFPVQLFIILSFLLATLCLAGGAFFLLAPQRLHRQIGFYTALVSLCLFITAQTLLYTIYKQYKDPYEAIVLEGKVAVKTSPNEESPLLNTLYEGTKINIVDTSSDQKWIAILLPDDKLGWLKRASIETVYPFTIK